MFIMVKSLAVAASVVGLIGGTNVQSQPNDDSSMPAYSAVVHHGPDITVVSASHNSVDALAGARASKAISVIACVGITGDGVRIRSASNPSAAVLGLAYRGDRFQLHDDFSSPDGRWAEGTDLRNGVHGWVAFEFLGQDWSAC
jgi:hypothetical protein